MNLRKVMTFYQYRALTENKQWKYLENYLQGGVYLAPLESFNDPFEGAFIPTLISISQILNDTVDFEECFKLCQETHPDLTREALRENLKANIEQEYLPMIETDFFSKHGAMCLTIKNNSILMWSYYASNHTGYCIEFELDFGSIKQSLNFSDQEITTFMQNHNSGANILSFNSEEEHFFHFVRVNYVEHPLSINHQVAQNISHRYGRNEYIIKNSVGVKFKEWEHEEEFKLIANANSRDHGGLVSLNEYMPFLKVTGIIMGSRMPEQNKKKVYDLCKRFRVKLYQAMCSKTAYEIIITDHTAKPSLR